MNYANYSLQLFTCDEVFYRGIRYGGPTRIMASPARMPSQAVPEVESLSSTKQLQKLLDALADETHLRTFISTIDGGIRRMLPAPSAFAEFLSAMAGRPLTLISMG